MTRAEAIEKLAFVERECRRVRESIERGENQHLREAHGAVEALCAASCTLDAVYEGPVEAAGGGEA